MGMLGRSPWGSANSCTVNANAPGIQRRALQQVGLRYNGQRTKGTPGARWGSSEDGVREDKDRIIYFVSQTRILICSKCDGE